MNYSIVSSNDDVFDIRDIMAEVEDTEDTDDLRPDLVTLLDEVKDDGGDEQWRGDWYPVTFIRDTYFETYAQELAEDIGAINTEASWPLYCIDWKRAADDLKMDYSTVEFDGITYWYR